MKKILLIILSSLTVLLTTPAVHASPSVSITAPTHRLFGGTFIDDSLSSELAPNGSLGKLIFPPTYRYDRYRTWFIDPALIEEVVAMTSPYTLLNGEKGTGSDIAIAWMARLHAVLVNATIYAIPHGNPSEYWVNRITPHDRNYILQSSRARLAEELGVNVLSATTYTSTSYFTLRRDEVNAIKRADADLLRYAMYMSAEQVDGLKSSMYKILNRGLASDRRGLLARDLEAANQKIEGTLHLVAGKFTVTSTNQKLPVTIVNGFANQVKVNLRITSTNQRILVSNQKNIVIAGRSKAQILIPVRVVATGSTGLDITITNTSGTRLAPPVIYPISVTVISPIATWITTIAAGILFLAAVVRSIRKLRRRR